MINILSTVHKCIDFILDISRVEKSIVFIIYLFFYLKTFAGVNPLKTFHKKFNLEN